MKKLPRNIRAWLGELNRFTQFGLIVVIVGEVIDLIYHGVLETILPLPVAQADIVQYAGHDHRLYRSDTRGNGWLT